MTVLSAVCVRARAVIAVDGGIVVARERRHGKPYTTIPGGRVGAGESAVGAVVREVHEETGLEITVERLLFVAEVVAGVGRQDLNLIFLGKPVGEVPAEVDVLGFDDEQPDDRDSEQTVLPPILDHIRRGSASGWEGQAVWLGNIWKGELSR